MDRKDWTPVAAAAGIGAGIVFAAAAIARGLSTVAGLREERGGTKPDAAKPDTTKPDKAAAAMTASTAVAPLTPNPTVAPVSTSAEHVPTDLMGDEHPDGSARAVDAFRPDMSAPIPEAERDAFRPALGAPTLVKGEADDIPRRSAEASSDGMGTVGGLEAVGGVGSDPSLAGTVGGPESPKVG